MAETETLAFDEADASLDAALEKAGVSVPSEPGEETENATPARGRDASGRFTKSSEKEGSSEAPVPEPSDEGGESEPGDTVKPDVDEERLAGALSALKRARAPQSVIDSMMESDANALIAWGEEQAVHQAEIDEKFKDRAADRQRLAEYEKTLGKLKESDGDGVAPPASADQVSGTVSQQLDEMSKRIGEYFGEDDLAQVLRAPIETIFASLQKQVNEQLAVANGVIDAASRDQLTKTFKWMKDDEGYKRVLDRMAQIEHIKDYSSRFTLMHDAAEIEFASELHKEAKALNASNRKKRDAGQIQPTSSAPMPEATASLSELRELLLEAKMEHDSERADDIKRRIREMTTQ